MSITEDLMNYLAAQLPAVEFALTLAMPDATPPLVEVTLQQTRRSRTTEGTINGRVTEYEFECWHTNTMNAAALADSITTLLQDYTGNLDGTSNVLNTLITNEFQGSDGAAELFNTTFTVTFTHI